VARGDAPTPARSALDDRLDEELRKLDE